MEAVMDTYKGMAVGVLEVDDLVTCFAAMDAAAKAADIRIQNIERNRYDFNACVKFRGKISDINAAMEAAVSEAEKYGKVIARTVIASPLEETEPAFYMTVSD